MQIKEKWVLEFQRLYEQEFGEKISYEQAYSECLDMFILGKILFRPITKEDLKSLQELNQKTI